MGGIIKPCGITSSYFLLPFLSSFFPATGTGAITIDFIYGSYPLSQSLEPIE